MADKNRIYIVAGDEMQKLFGEKYPEFRCIPFREDLSKGRYGKDYIDDEFICERSSFWGVSKEEYAKNMEEIIKLDMLGDYTLCFGLDDCCQANMNFLIRHFKASGYCKTLRIRIVDEYSLTILDEYDQKN